MPNWSGTFAAFQALVRPRIAVPNLIVQDIRELDFSALRKAGFERVVLDKDNCLTLPHQDRLIPDLETAWKELSEEFGSRNLLLVSNSAGSRDDAGGIAAESVSHSLGVSVLQHSSLKPSWRTISAIHRYFASISSPTSDHRKWIVIGDRVFTDIVLANRLGAYGVLVTRDWKNSLWSTFVSRIEHAAVRIFQRWTGSHTRVTHVSKFTKSIPERKDKVNLGYSGSTWTWSGRALGLGRNSGKERRQ